MQKALTIEEKDARIAELEAKVASLESELYYLRKKVFGKMSEKNLPSDPMQEPTLFDNEMTISEALAIDVQKAKDEEIITRTITVKAGKDNRKALDTTKLPVEEEHLYPENITEEYVEIAPEVTDTLAIQPAKMYIKRIVRHKFVLKSSLQIKEPEKQTFKIAPLPLAPIHKCMASSSILADRKSVV